MVTTLTKTLVSVAQNYYFFLKQTSFFCTFLKKSFEQFFILLKINYKQDCTYSPKISMAT